MSLAAIFSGVTKIPRVPVNGTSFCERCGEKYQRLHCVICPKCNSRRCAFSGEGKGCDYCDGSGD